MKRFLFLALLSLSFIVVENHAAAEGLPVFPGAMGFGITTPAGRGGTVYKVTNLNDSGPGSLKNCIDQSGPRTCVFEVSGTIRLPDTLKITTPYITIAGQTAPSPGITLRGATLSIQTHDVLVQHIRVRAGDDPEGTDPHKRDSIQINGGRGPVYNIVIDHVSASWGVDENIGMWHDTTTPSLRDITISNSIISEGLWDSIHPEGTHSMGFLIAEGAEHIAIIGNLFAHNNDRNPKCNGGPGTIIVNNLVYNRGFRGTYLSGNEGGILKASVVGNVYITGSNTGSHRPIWIRNLPEGSAVYLDDNMSDGNLPADAWSNSIVEVEGSPNITVSSPPVWASPLTLQPSSEVRASVLANAGARPGDRDSVDKRIIDDVQKGTGRIIDTQDEVGGWPDLPENYRPLTLPNNPNGDDDGDGYTNLEEWLHGFAAEVEEGGAVTVLSIVSLAPVADTWVNSSRPTTNYGSATTLKVDGSSTKITFLRFNVTGLSGAVHAARLRLEVVNGSAFGGTVYSLSDNSWDENGLNFNTRPVIDGPALDALGKVTAGDVVELNVTPAIVGNGIYSFAIDSNNSDGVQYRSREDLTNPPDLIVTTD